MTRLLLYPLNVLYLAYLTLLTILIGCLLPVILPVLILLNKGRIDDGLRLFNYLYGMLLIKISWPLIRIKRTGTAYLPKNNSCVVVVNHRSSSDMFFGPYFTTHNTTVFVRSWPFRIWIFKWFMLLAGYVDIEKTSLNDFFKKPGWNLYNRGVSFLFFPEGHRSRDGKLQRFRSGAFMTATEYNIPIIPVCLTGTEKFLSINNPLIRPAEITIKILPPVLPSSFPAEKRAFKLKKFVESMFREQLNELPNE